MALTGEKELIAPCALYCGTCAFYYKSRIKDTVLHLKELLNCFERIAKKYENDAPELKGYPVFTSVMEYLGKQDCRGCRQGGGTVRGAACNPNTCPIAVCVSKKGLDFCYQCAEFPCEKIPTTFTRAGESLLKTWRTGNQRMKEIGLDRYLQEKKSEPRYKPREGCRT